MQPQARTLAAVWLLLLSAAAAHAQVAALPSLQTDLGPSILAVPSIPLFHASTAANLPAAAQSQQSSSSVSSSEHECLLSLTELQQQRQQGPGSKPMLQDSRPYTIAHRGASGVLPEHTLPAYTTAIAQGADFIECDLVVTRDLQLICRHEPNLNTTTDAWSLFPDRLATYDIDGERVTGIFACDLTLSEVQQLSAKQRWEFRQQAASRHSIPTFQQFLDTALSADRAIGIYPEVKHPTWHNQLPHMAAAGVTIEQLMLHQLHAFGYAASAPVGSAAWRSRPVFIQSFEPSSLKRLAASTNIPLVLLMGGWPGYVAPDSGMTHEQMTSDEFLAELATYAAGVGPWKSSLYQVVAHTSNKADHAHRQHHCEGCGSRGATSPEHRGLASDDGCCLEQPPNNSSSSSGSGSMDNAVAGAQLIHPDIGALTTGNAGGNSKVSVVSTGLTAKLHKHGLSVHPYTLRDEQQFVLEGCANIGCEFEWLFHNEHVDGGFADYPGTLYDWLIHRQQHKQQVLQ
jgi:glycerophosphoryl diester phosphodiesterase